MIGIFRNRSDPVRIDLIADGKHQLQIFIFRQGRDDSVEDIHPAIQYRPH